MRKKRNPETAKEREDRLKDKAQKRTDEAAAVDDALDAMVQRSIERHGP